MPDQFIQCRDFSHSWRPHHVEWIAKERVYEQTLRCTRCKTYRNRLIGRDGELLRSNYEYTEGYLVKGMGRLTGADRDHVRLASVVRMLQPAAAKAG